MRALFYFDIKIHKNPLSTIVALSPSLSLSLEREVEEETTPSQNSYEWSTLKGTKKRITRFHSNIVMLHCYCILFKCVYTKRIVETVGKNSIFFDDSGELFKTEKNNKYEGKKQIYTNSSSEREKKHIENGTKCK